MEFTFKAKRKTTKKTTTKKKTSEKTCNKEKQAPALAKKEKNEEAPLMDIDKKIEAAMNKKNKKIG